MQYNLYWNNICLIGKLEERYITQKTSEFNLPLKTSYFGLGRKSSLLDQIKNELESDHVNADIILSTDTDVFQDRDLLPSAADFAIIEDAFSVHESLSGFISPCKRFIPFIIIPLIGVYNKNLIHEHELPKSYQDFINSKYKKKYAFGGLHNSAGRSLLKAVWYRYGEQFARLFLKNALPQVMPSAAYNAVASGKSAFSIVPTIFANRAVGDLGTFTPSEGIIPIPSYIAVKEGVDLTIINKHLLNDDLRDMFVKNASVISTSRQAKKSPAQDDFFVPSWEFMYNLDHNYFRNVLLSYAR